MAEAGVGKAFNTARFSETSLVSSESHLYTFDTQFNT
jgi:hypothetical protein